MNPVAHSSTPESDQHLSRFLVSHFTVDELRRFLLENVSEDLDGDLPSPRESKNQYVFEVITLLRRKELLDIFTDAIRQRRPAGIISRKRAISQAFVAPWVGLVSGAMLSMTPRESPESPPIVREAQLCGVTATHRLSPDTSEPQVGLSGMVCTNNACGSLSQANAFKLCNGDRYELKLISHTKGRLVLLNEIDGVLEHIQLHNLDRIKPNHIWAQHFQASARQKSINASETVHIFLFSHDKDANAYLASINLEDTPPKSPTLHGIASNRWYYARYNYHINKNCRSR